MHNICYLCKKQIFEVNGTYLCIDGHINKDNMVVVESFNTQSQKSFNLKVERINYFEIFKINKAENFFNIIYFTTYEMICDFLKNDRFKNKEEIYRKFLNIFFLSYNDDKINIPKNYKVFQVSAYFVIYYFLHLDENTDNVNICDRLIFNIEEIDKKIFTVEKFNSIIFPPKVFMQKIKKVCFKIFNADFIDRLKIQSSITFLNINDFLKFEKENIFILKYIQNSNKTIYSHCINFITKYQIRQPINFLKYILSISKICNFENIFLPPEYFIYFSIITLKKYLRLQNFKIPICKINKDLNISTRAFIAMRRKTYLCFEILFSKNYKNY